MAAPNNARCPRCKAKLRVSAGPYVNYRCGRCGYSKNEEPDNMTKEFLWGPLFKTRRMHRGKNSS